MDAGCSYLSAVELSHMGLAYYLDGMAYSGSDVRSDFSDCFSYDGQSELKNIFIELLKAVEVKIGLL